MADKKCLDGTGLRTVADWVISKLSGKSDTSHKHTKSQITDFPTALKNPNALTVQFNGTTNQTYDGSVAKTVNITPANIGAAASSHTHSYLPLTGGNVTGRTLFYQGNGVIDLSVGAGTAGYMYACQLKFTGTYQNQPIRFRVLQRERYGEIYIKFAVGNTTNAALHWFYITGNISAYIVKSDTTTWDLYIQKSEAYDSIAITELQKGGYMAGVSITWINSTVTSLPDGYVTATLLTDRRNISGNAASATALTTSAGSATKPVYFSSGKPVECSYSIQKSVPADAVFTDTNTWRGIQNNLTSDSTTDSLSAAQGKALKALVDGKAASSHKHAKSDITDMPTSLPANGGNADTVDGKHASDFLLVSGLATNSNCLYMPRVQGDVNWLPDTGERTMIREFSSASANLPNSAWYHILASRSADVSYGSQLAIGMTTNDLYYRCYAAGNFENWHRAGVDVVIGTSSGTVAYKSGYTKALIEFWKTTVGSASRTVYDAALITGLSSSMTASTPSAISSGQDFAFALGNDASGGIIISGNYSKYKITYFN